MRVRVVAGILCFWCLGAAALAAVPSPVLKWRQGSYSPVEFNKGMYGSAAVADLNGDGKKEVIWANYKVYCFDGATGNLIWSFYAGSDRSNPSFYRAIRTYASVVVADINNDGQLEVVTAHESGWLCAYTKDGYFLPGFPTQPAGRTDEITSLSVFDLDKDGKREIIIGWAMANPLNVCVVRYNGTVASGWPQYVASTNYNALGIFNTNIAVGDINGDGYGEVIVPSDTGKICAYSRDGTPLPTNPVFGANTIWPMVVNYDDYAHEKAGWYPDANFWMGTDHPATIADVNGDGTYEVVIVGEVYTNPPDQVNFVSLFSRPFIYNADRTRFNKGGFNWESGLPKTGASLSTDFNVIGVKRSNPVVVDLDGDGRKEILSSSSDGKLHCYWLDKTEHGRWPVDLQKPGEGVLRFSSEPVVVDLDGNGSLEVVFTTWPQYRSNRGGELFILNGQGDILRQVALPYGDPNGAVGELAFDGAFAAPTVADVDGDGEPEILCGTVYAGLVVYDLPGATAGAAPWPTGRGDFARTGWTRSSAGVQRMDLSGDGKPDILWQNQVSGYLYVWFMNGTTATGQGYLTPSWMPTAWQVRAIADFNADSSPDLLFHNQVDGSLYVHFMHGAVRTGGSSLSPSGVAPDWQIAGVADFNADGKPDLLWRHSASGQLYIWYMDGTMAIGGASPNPATVPTPWEIRGLADFNGDGRTDILLHNQSTGSLYAYFMDGITRIGGASLSPSGVPPQWQIRQVADFNGDGKPDIVWHDQTLGSLYVWFMDGTMQIGGRSLSPSLVSPEWQIRQ
jgi:hypothetical protein